MFCDRLTGLNTHLCSIRLYRKDVLKRIVQLRIVRLPDIKMFGLVLMLFLKSIKIQQQKINEIRENTERIGIERTDNKLKTDFGLQEIFFQANAHSMSEEHIEKNHIQNDTFPVPFGFSSIECWFLQFSHHAYW